MRKKISSILFAGFMLLSAVSMPVSAQASAGDVDIVTFGSDGQSSFLVTYEDGEYNSLEAWAESKSVYEIQRHNPNRSTALVSGPRWQIQTPGFSDHLTQAMLAGTPVADTPLEGRSYIKSVEPNYRHALPNTPNEVSEDDYTAPKSDWLVQGSFTTDGIAWDGNANESTMADVRNVTSVDQVGVNGSGVDIAVLDTGANIRNGTDDAIYGTSVADGYNFVTDEPAKAANDYTNVSNSNLHGDWVLSSIVASPANASHTGVAPGANAYVGKVLDDDGSGSTEDIVDGIYWAEQQDTDYLSLSLGSLVYDEAIATAVRDYLRGNGTAAVIAVGNSRMTGRVAEIASPSDIPEAGVISVASTNVSVPASAGPSYYSQTGFDSGITDGSMGETRGQKPDIAAPGQEIKTVHYTDGGTSKTSRVLSGTSMSTPVVTGILALGLDANPSWENDTETVADWVNRSASPVPGAAVGEVGAGMINANMLVSKTETNQTQEEAMTDAANARNRALHSLGLDFRFQAIRQLRAAVGA